MKGEIEIKQDPDDDLSLPGQQDHEEETPIDSNPTEEAAMENESSEVNLPSIPVAAERDTEEGNDNDHEEEHSQEYESLEKDLDSIDRLLDQFDQRSDHLKHEILSLLNDLKSQHD